MLKKDLIESEAIKVKPSKRYIAKNTKSVKVLEEFSNDWDYDVRCGVANNMNCSVEVFEKLSKDSNYYVRCGVAWNKNCPVEILEKLSNNQDDVIVQCYASKNLDRIRSAKS